MRGSLRPFLIKLALFVVFTTTVTAMLAAVIGNIQPFTDFYEMKAEFTDATGLLRNDLVKVAGVNVGKVTGAEVADGKALVFMQV
ncbi:MAG: MlaD family protein, partial [Candidatus Limnocylindria bacterium]